MSNSCSDPTPSRHSAQRPRLLAVGSSQTAISLTRVASGILHAIAPDFDLHQLALGYDGDPHDCPWKLYPAARPNDPYGFTRIPELIERLQPDLVFFMTEPVLLAEYLKKLHNIETLPPLVAYVPIDGAPLPAWVAAELAQLDTLVLCTEFSRAVATRALELYRIRGGKLRRLPATQVIPHALDRALFYPINASGKPALGPIPDRRALRQRHWPEQPELWDDFIVLNANRNQRRKRIDITMQGFAEFARGKPNVKLCLHMGLTDKGWNIPDLADHYGIKDKIILGTDKAAPPTVNDKELNVIYNLCDAGLNTSLAEGWGLVSFEHAATGAAQIVPGFGNCAELWAGSAELLPPALTLFHKEFAFEEKLIAPQSVAEALDRFYSDPDYLRRQSFAAYQRACDPELSPRRLAARWRAMFDSVLREGRPAAAKLKITPSAAVTQPHLTGGAAME